MTPVLAPDELLTQPHLSEPDIAALRKSGAVFQA
jgi:hypothetical protein